MHYELNAASMAFAAANSGGMLISYPNVTFNPPAKGAMYLRFAYMPVITRSEDLSRRCLMYRGLVQIDVVFSPDTGMDKAMKEAGRIAKAMTEGVEVGPGYVYNFGEIHPVQKSDTGLFIPVRCQVEAFEHKEI